MKNCRCISTALSEGQLQNIEQESANRSLFVRELVVSTLSQALPELMQHLETSETSSLPSTTNASISPETVNANLPVASPKKLNSSQETKREQNTCNKHTTQQQSTQQQQSHVVQAATGSIGGATVQSQGLPPNPGSIGAQTAPINPSLMHSVIPQSMVSLHNS